MYLAINNNNLELLWVLGPIESTPFFIINLISFNYLLLDVLIIDYFLRSLCICYAC